MKYGKYSLFYSLRGGLCMWRHFFTVVGSSSNLLDEFSLSNGCRLIFRRPAYDFIFDENHTMLPWQVIDITLEFKSRSFHFFYSL